MKSVALRNLGCKVNAYEMDVMQHLLQEKGYNIVAFDTCADIYIVNTCSVTNIADRKSRQILHRAKKNNPNALVVAVGCYVQTGKEAVEKDECIDLAIGNNRKKDLIPILEEFLDTMDNQCIEPVIDINHTDEYEEMQLVKTAGNTRAYIKIQDGCNQFCTYCIIPYARGRVRSRKQEDIIKEVKGLVEKGYKEIVLTGIHLSSYGNDFIKKSVQENKTADYLEENNEGAFLSLIKEIHQIEYLKRIRLGSLEPRILTEYFISELRKLEKTCPHFHLSLQSGCDETLGRMNRRYNASEYYEKVQLLRKHFTDVAITTDIIVGFPGETQEEFDITKNFIDRIHFYEMHIFKYSKRQGTKAAVMDHQVPDTIKAARSDELIKKEEQQSKLFRALFINQSVSVLMEETKEIEGKIYQLGYSKQYIKVAVESSANLENQIVQVVPTSFLTNTILLGQI
ncbi:MAG TPA: tRNA (N(6)-L-threonylcarbamoyladenosine(37)-C(2))-methylthiotransferase MtaB [Lachnospiraceae bacterium]|nr:tRNA (N(6)-L-threonylcarbamoyladenosine(37)-C(2))-methylthiotransferase MtaB [Lachnospiraceae bacterium]